MGFMDKPFDAVKKRTDLSTRSTSGTAQNAVTNHSYTQGKSRVQGGRGAGQASQGWKSQYAGAGDSYSKQINPIINSLSNNNVSFKMPEVTAPLLSQEGFKQALGVVGARNNAKLQMQNKKVQQGMLGSLLNAESQNNALSNRFAIADMNNKTDRRGQDFTKESRANTLAQKGEYNSMMGKYYDAQTDIGKERNVIAKEKALNAQNPKPTNPLDDRIKRQKLIEENGIGGLINSEQFGTLSSDQQADIKGRFIMTGELPQLSGGDDGTLWDTSAKVSYGESNQSPQAQQAPTAQPQQETPKQYSIEDTNNAMKAFADGSNLDMSHLSRQGDNFIYDDGSGKKKTYPISDIMSKMGN